MEQQEVGRLVLLDQVQRQVEYCAMAYTTWKL